MDAHCHFPILARYNVWALRRPYEHIDALGEGEHRRHSPSRPDHRDGSCLPQIDLVEMLQTESVAP